MIVQHPKRVNKRWVWPGSDVRPHRKNQPLHRKSHPIAAHTYLEWVTVTTAAVVLVGTAMLSATSPNPVPFGYPNDRNISAAGNNRGGSGGEPGVAIPEPDRTVDPRADRHGSRDTEQPQADQPTAAPSSPGTATQPALDVQPQPTSTPSAPALTPPPASVAEGPVPGVTIVPTTSPTSESPSDAPSESPTEPVEPGPSDGSCLPPVDGKTGRESMDCGPTGSPSGDPSPSPTVGSTGDPVEESSVGASSPAPEADPESVQSSASVDSGRTGA